MNYSELTYPSLASPWRTLEIKNIFLNSLAIAIATTLISYQATATVMDLVLGFKKKNVAQANALHILLLIRQSSPLAVCNSLLRNDWLTRRYYNGDVPPSTEIVRENQRIRLNVVIKVLLLLASAPLLNIASLVLTLETEKIFTFKEAGFEGIGLGINFDLAVAVSDPINELCVRTPVKENRGDQVVADFSVCGPPPITGARLRSEGQVSVVLQEDHTICIEVQVGFSTVKIIKQGSMHTDGRFFRVKAVPTRDSALPLVNMGMDLVAIACGFANSASAYETNKTAVLRGVVYLRSKKILCTGVGTKEKESVKIARSLEKHITMVPLNNLEVKEEINGQESEIRNAAHLPFLKRKQRNLGLTALVIFATVTVILRIVTASLWNNDIDDGIETLVKERLGFKCCQSMLRHGDSVISYRKKYQAGMMGQYGLTRRDMPEVKQFFGGRVGGVVPLESMEGESWALYSRSIDEEYISGSEPKGEVGTAGVQESSGAQQACN